MKGLLRTEFCLTGGRIMLCILFGSGLLMPLLPSFCILCYTWLLTMLAAAAPLFASTVRYRSRLNRYMLTLPYSRAQTVNARYLYYLSAALLCAAWLILLYAFLRLRADTARFSMTYGKLLPMQCRMMLLGLSFILPCSLFCDRFEKNRMGVLAFMLYEFVFLGKMFVDLLDLVNSGSDSSAAELKRMPLLIPGFAVSWCISRAVYCGGFRRKEASE